MIRKLQNKFIAIATLSMCVMILLVLFLINMISSIRNRQESGALLQYIANNDGYIPSFQKSEITHGDLEVVLTPETQFETRYFAVRFENGKVVDVNLEHVAAFSQENAATFAERLLERKDERGSCIVDGRSYDYLVREVGKDVALVVVLDTTRLYNSTVSMIRFSTYVGLIMIGLFFVMVSVLSRRVLKPIIDNIDSQKQFITNASHELKTPLAIISANTEVIEMTAGESEWTKSIRNQIERLNGLIGRLITLAKLQEYGQTELTEVNASAITRDVVISFQPVLSQSGKEFVHEIEEEVMVMAEDRSFHELVSILVDNAAKYCDDNGKVEVRLSKKGRTMTLAVSNSYAEGEGVDYSRFFDRFYRQDQSHNSEKKGYGIGLSMASEMVQKFKGKISVTYKDGMICFTVTI
ncbi:MAG: HAMP domain-containing histidine kinase [Lachnospiraceae bacterium]|nr:HAMP domain-containing histidine kinase [Lachnospiraceae bacterium]